MAGIATLPRWARYITDPALLNMFRELYEQTTGVNQTARVIMHKNGSDAYDGTSIARAVATFDRALVRATQMLLDHERVMIEVVDSETYNYSLVLPAHCDLLAPGMHLVGVENGAPTLLIGSDCVVRLHKVSPNPDATPGDFVSNSAILKQASGFSRCEVFDVTSGVAGIAVASVSNDGALHLQASLVHVTHDSFGIGGGFANDFGHLHAYCGDIYLEGNNAVGVVSGQNSTSVANVLGTVEHLIERGGPFTGTVAFAALGDIGSFGKIVMQAGTVDADTLGIETEGCLVRVLLSDGRMIAGNVVSEPIYGMQPLTERGAANGYATLGADGKVPSAQLPASSVGALDYQGGWDADTNTPAIPAAAVGNAGHYYVVTVAGATEIDGISSWSLGDWIVSDGVVWERIANTQNVLSVAGKTGVVTLDADDVGLGNVDNTADADKPISTAVSTALAGKQSTSEKGATNGYASLGSDGRVPTAQLPTSLVGALSYQGAWNANTNSPSIGAAAVGNKGHYYVVSVAGTTSIDGISSWALGDWIVSNGTAWQKIDNSQAVQSVAGKTGAVTLVKGDVGLGNVDNTSDANKPVSTAQQTALNAKQSTSEKGASNGYASLDSGGKVPAAQLPASIVGAVTYQGTWDANVNSPTIPAAASGNKGYYYKVSVAGATNINGTNDWKVGDWIISNGTAWEKVDNTDQVTSVAGRQGAVVLSSTDVGLENCNNTSDANKPVSTATAAALKVYQNVRTPTDNATLELTDAGGLIEMNKATAVNLTVPTNASVAIPVNSVIDVAQYGAGQVTFVPADGTVTIRSSGGKLKLTGQYSGATLVKRGTNEWYLFGDIAA